MFVFTFSNAENSLKPKKKKNKFQYILFSPPHISLDKNISFLAAYNFLNAFISVDFFMQQLVHEQSWLSSNREYD